MKKFYLFIFVCIGVSGVYFGVSRLPFLTTDEFESVDITVVPEHLPYLTTAIRDYQLRPNYYSHLGKSAVFVNADDDAPNEIIRSSPRYLQCNEYSAKDKTIHWQLNLDPEYYVAPENGNAFGLSDPLDLNRETPMIIANGQTLNGDNNRFWILDPKTGTVLNTFDIAGGIDRNGDGRWDGAFRVIGTIDIPGDSGPRRAVILVCKVGFDVEMRGVYAVDPWTGETIWSFVSGASIIGNGCRIIDMDGDGSEEIIATSLAPCNMGQRKINGFGDDKSYLIALDTDGSLLWSKTLTEEAASCNLQIGDMSGSGVNEIITISSHIYATGSILSVWNTEGELLASLESKNKFQYGLLFPNRHKNQMDIITGNQVSSVYRVELNSGELEITKELTNELGMAVLGKIKLPDDSGEGVITMDRGGIGRILGQNLDVVAKFEEDKPVFYSDIISSLQDNQISFIGFKSTLGTIVLKSNPDNALVLAFKRLMANSRWVLLSGLAMGIALAWIFWRLVRNKINQPSEAPPPTETNHTQLQERRLHLLEDLEISNHGAMAPLRSLRRLLWMLDAVHSGVGVNPTLVARLNEIWQDCHDDALPRLTNILERARQAQISDLLVNNALTSIGLINSNLTELKKESFTEKAVANYLTPLHKEEIATEAMLQSLRRQVGEHFQAPLISVMDKVLRANQNCLEEYGIEVQKGMVASAAAGSGSTELPNEEIICRMDTDELGFILDNLVDNACRAMDSSPQRKLRITWQSTNGLVKIEVADTGIGIATEDHQKVVETGYSTRPGGGLGLPKSQRLLRKYGGHLSVKSSEPGKGTTFSLVVPRS